MKDIKLNEKISNINLDLLSSDIKIYSDSIRQPLVRYEGDFDIKDSDKTATIKEKASSNSVISNIKGNSFNSIVIINGKVTVNGKTIINGSSSEGNTIELILPNSLYGDTNIPVSKGKNNISISIDSKSGDINIKDLNSEKLSIKTLSGDVKLENVILSELIINTLRGDIDLKDIDSLFSDLDSKSGDIRISIMNSIINYQTFLKTLIGDTVQKTTETTSPIISETKNRLEANTLSGDIKVLFKGKK